jgi:hypothetical protein
VTSRASPSLAWLLVGALGLACAMGCAAALETESGVVITVDSPAIGRIDAFELRTSDGRIMTFDATELQHRPEFPAAHLTEHRALADPVRVTFRKDGERLVVVRLDDAG